MPIPPSMALDFDDPEILAQEIERAETLTKYHIDVVDELVLNYTGSRYRSDRQPDEEQPENAAYEYAALMLPLLAYDNPAVQVETRRVTTDAQTALGMEEALNAWIIEHDLQKLFELAAIDFLFSYGVLLTTFEPYGGTDSPDLPPIMSPRVHYVSPRRFFLDPLAVAPLIDGEGFDGLRFMGHRWVRDLSALEGDKRFDQAAVAQLASEVDTDKLDRPIRDRSPFRGEVVGYEVWVPPEVCDPRATTNGMIYTLAAHQRTTDKKGKAIYLREPRPYYGPEWGPYSFFGAYPVPNQCHPLSPLAALAALCEEVNGHANAASRAAGREKTLTLVNSSDNAAAKAVKDGKDGEIWKVPGLNPNSIVQLEQGGVSPQRYDYLKMLRERYDRNSGVSETRRGNVTGNELATAITAANSASSQRDSYLKKKFAQSASQVLKTAAWYFHQSPNVVRPLSAAAGKRLGMNYPVFHGGPQPGQEKQTFTDLGLRIEPYSMERPNEGQLQQITLQLVNWLTGMAPNMPQLLWIDFKEMLDIVAKIFNQRGLTRIFLPDRLEQLRQMVAQQAANQKPPQKSPVESLNYKDAPPDIQRQIEAQAGLQPSQVGITNQQRVELIGHQNANNRDLRAGTHDLIKHRAAEKRAAMEAAQAAANPTKPRQPAGAR